MMNILDAWRALGEDPDIILSEIKLHENVVSRVRSAESALRRAEKISRVLMATHHPDKNPGDEMATSRFIRVKDAIASIRFHTEELRKSSYSNDFNVIIFK